MNYGKKKNVQDPVHSTPGDMPTGGPGDTHDSFMDSHGDPLMVSIIIIIIITKNNNNNKYIHK